LTQTCSIPNYGNSHTSEIEDCGIPDIWSEKYKERDQILPKKRK
jgi:hypothetical protein